MVVQSGGVEGAAKRRQRVEQPGDLIDQRGVVVFPAGLVLLRAVMMVDGVKHAGGQLGRCAEQQGRFAAVGPDLDTDAAVEVPHGGVIKRATLVGRHESAHLLGGRDGFTIMLCACCLPSSWLISAWVRSSPRPR